MRKSNQKQKHNTKTAMPGNTNAPSTLEEKKTPPNTTPSKPPTQNQKQSSKNTETLTATTLESRIKTKKKNKNTNVHNGRKIMQFPFWKRPKENYMPTAGEKEVKNCETLHGLKKTRHLQLGEVKPHWKHNTKIWRS